MQELRVIGVESGALLVSTDAGSEFRLPVTHSLQSQLRQANPEHTPAAPPKVSPREIQASIRGGRTAEQIVADTGADLDYVRRFEGPVLDERAFVLETARSVSVSVVGMAEAPGGSARFGDVIDTRLDEAEATDRQWTSYKDPALGWIVHVAYTTQEIEREASWRFDPKRQALSPESGDAQTLSRQDGKHTSLVPRLRAVGGDSLPDESGRFDSGAFEPAPVAPETTVPGDDTPDSVAIGARAREGRSAASVAAMNRAPEAEPSHNQTADLLEALRRRRGERESARFDGDGDSDAQARAAHPSTGSLRVIDVPFDDFDGPETSEPADAERSGRPERSERPEPPRATKPLATHPTASRRTETQDDTAGQQEQRRPERQKSTSGSRRKGRASMPSWDEIVFGARSDDDPA